MCKDCGCGDHELVPVEVGQKILAENDRVAGHMRAHFEEDRTLAINLMGSPGSGKTALLEATARRLPDLRLAALSGDLATDLDGQRLSKAGIAAASITTGSACHLDARLVHDALHDHPLGDADILFIENVGNLVCPAIYDLGQAFRVVTLSVTEGEDKPLKYPVIFRDADLVVITKIDLLPHLDVDLQNIRDALALVMPDPRAIAVSAKTGEGFAAWIDWLQIRARSKPLEVGLAPAANV